jgi:hypothetical protein
MTAAKVTVNGHSFDEYRGGYTPFSFELTPHLKYGADNLLAVEVDSTERADIPPFGSAIDYLTFGGIYREVELRVVPQTHLANISPSRCSVMSNDRSWWCAAISTARSRSRLSITAELRDGDRVLKTVRSVTVRGRRSTTCHSKGSANPTVGPEASQAVPGDGAARQWRRLHHAHRLSRSPLHRARLLPERRARQTARPQSPPDVSLMSAAPCRRACRRATPRCCARN